MQLRDDLINSGLTPMTVGGIINGRRRVESGRNPLSKHQKIQSEWGE